MHNDQNQEIHTDIILLTDLINFIQMFHYSFNVLFLVLILSRFPRRILLSEFLCIPQCLKKYLMSDALRLKILYFLSYFSPLILTSIDYSYLKQWTQCLPNADFSTSIVLSSSFIKRTSPASNTCPFFFLINVFKVYLYDMDSWVFVL